MRIILSIIFLLGCLSSIAQRDLIIVGKVVDHDNGESISNVHIFAEEQGRGATSNNLGEFELQLNKAELISLKASHVAYRDSTFNITAANLDTLFINIALKFKIELIGTALVSTEHKVDTVYGDKIYHVADLVFIENELLLLTYEKEDRWKRKGDSEKTIYSDCKLVLLDEHSKVKYEKAFKNDALSIYKEYMGKAFLICQDGKYEVLIDSLGIDLKSITDDDFVRFVEPVLDTLNNQVLLTDFDKTFPAFYYYAYLSSDSTLSNIRYIEDAPLMQLFRSEYKYLNGADKRKALQYQLDTGVDKEIAAAYMSGFAQNQYYEELYAPLFVMNDTVLIFDHYNDYCYRMDRCSTPLDSIPISYHKQFRKYDWEKKLFCDEISGRFYSLFERNGYSYLMEINIETGKADRFFKLSFRYPEQIAIRDNEVYYVYRPFESLQKKYLYKESIELQKF